MNAFARKLIQTQIASRAGAPVELTIHNERSYAICTDVVVPELGDVTAAYFGNRATVTATHDDGVGSLVFVEMAA